jgi:hypothetical protein
MHTKHPDLITGRKDNPRTAASVGCGALLTRIPTIDDVLNDHATALRDDFIGMIADHHKITPSTADPDSLIEAFRRADWIDVTRGLRRFGIPRPFVARLFATWPSAGFHWRLLTLTLDRFRSHPLTPLPMVRL